MTARQTAAWLLLVAACGKEPGRAPRAAVPPRDAAPPVAVSSDPLGEASLVDDITWLTSTARRGRGSRTTEAADTARWIDAELAEAGYTTIVQSFRDVDRSTEMTNVIAIYGPRESTAATVLVTAHYDHLGEIDGEVYPGADDNASGVAVALAVARDLAQRRDVPGRVIFAFLGGEEIGLLGARAYVDAPPHPLAETRAVYNLDMVGRRFFESTIGDDAKIGAVGLPDDSALFDAASSAADEAALELVAVSPGLLAFVGDDWRSDDWVFRDRGVPSVHFSTGLHDDYHQPTDTADRLSRPQMTRIARFLRALVARTAR